MKVCFPVEKNDGLESVVFNHFGSSPMFIVVDTSTSEVRELNNNDLGHQHGHCHPLRALNGQEVNAIVLGGIGGGALSKLQAMNISVFMTGAATIKENLELLKNGKLGPMTSSCGGHGHGNGCAH